MRNTKRARGLTLLELVITLGILAILVSAALPLTSNAVKGRREQELRQALREMRDALDRFNRIEYGQFGGQRVPIEERTPSGYPKKLDLLFDGFVPVGRVDGKKVYYLRRVPVDPLTGKREWGFRSSTDAPDASSTTGEDVFDVYSLSTDKGLNDIPYREW